MADENEMLTKFTITYWLTPTGPGQTARIKANNAKAAAEKAIRQAFASDDTILESVPPDIMVSVNDAPKKKFAEL